MTQAAFASWIHLRLKCPSCVHEADGYFALRRALTLPYRNLIPAQSSHDYDIQSLITPDPEQRNLSTPRTKPNPTHTIPANHHRPLIDVKSFDISSSYTYGCLLAEIAGQR
jgi:hypothetical protein